MSISNEKKNVNFLNQKGVFNYYIDRHMKFNTVRRGARNP